MCLHCVRISGLRKNLKQFVIGKEIKSGESCSLDFKIVLHFLLNVFKFFIIFLELSKQLLTAATIINKWPLKSLKHNIFPEFINNNKLFIFFRKLFLNILSTENIF